MLLVNRFTGGGEGGVLSDRGQKDTESGHIQIQKTDGFLEYSKNILRNYNLFWWNTPSEFALTDWNSRETVSLRQSPHSQPYTYSWLTIEQTELPPAPTFGSPWIFELEQLYECKYVNRPLCLWCGVRSTPIPAWNISLSLLYMNIRCASTVLL